MKIYNKLTMSLTTLFIIAVLSLNFGGCSEHSPFQPVDNEDESATITTLGKKPAGKDTGGNKGGGKNKGNNSGSDPSLSDPTNAVNTSYAALSALASVAGGPTVESGSCVVHYQANDDFYSSGSINLAYGSGFTVENKSLTPPSGMHGDDVTITMDVVYNTETGELEFTFGPSGSHFDPPAEIKLGWKYLEEVTNTTIDNPKLYLVDESNGSYIEQIPDDIDFSNKKMFLKVHHFSRYRLGKD